MISKRKLKERLLDICAGADYIWDSDDEYFHSDDVLETIGNVITAIEKVFGFDDKNKSTKRLRSPWRLKDYEDIDTMTELVYEALSHDDI